VAACVDDATLADYISGRLYHVTTQGTERRTIFADERAYRHFLGQTKWGLVFTFRA